MPQMLSEIRQSQLQKRNPERNSYMHASWLELGQTILKIANCNLFTFFTFSRFSYLRGACFAKVAGVASNETELSGVSKIRRWYISRNSATLWKHSKVSALAVSGRCLVNPNGGPDKKPSVKNGATSGISADNLSRRKKCLI